MEDLGHPSAPDRAYVYLAGHGCRTDPDHPYLAQDALVLSNFDPAHPQESCVAVKELRTQLAQADIAEVVLILDCSRDFPAAGPIRPAGFGQELAGSDGPGRRFNFCCRHGHRASQPARATASPRRWCAAACESFTTMMLLAGLPARCGQRAGRQRRRPTSRVVRWSSLNGFLHAAFRASHRSPSARYPGLVFARRTDTSPTSR